MSSEMFLVCFIFAVIVLVCIIVGGVVVANANYFTTLEAMGRDPEEES